MKLTTMVKRGLLVGLALGLNLFLVPGGIIAQSQSAPVLTITPSFQNFGNVTVGKSKDLTFTVRNSGGGILTGNALTTLPYSIVAGDSFKLGAGQTQIVRVSFSPTSAGTFQKTVIFTSNGGNASRSVTGVGVQPAPLVTFGSCDFGGPTPGVLNFGNVTVFSSKTLTFSITYTQVGDGEFGQGCPERSGTASITNPNPASPTAFTISPNAFTIPGTSSAGQTRTKIFNVTFHPFLANGFTADACVSIIAIVSGPRLVISCDFTVTLNGTGLNLGPPIAQLSATPLSGNAPLLVSFTGAGSRAGAPVCQLTEFRWNFGDGTSQNTGMTPTVQHRYTATGSYQIVLTVIQTGFEGLCDGQASASVQIAVRETVVPIPKLIQFVQSCTAPGSLAFVLGDNLESRLWPTREVAAVDGRRALVAGTTRKLASVVVPTVTPPQDRAAVTIGSPTEGRSNTLPIDVDPSCTSGPITPEDERASFKLGENLLVFKPSCLSSVERNAFKRENGYASLQSWGLGGDLELFVIGRLQNKTALNTVNTAQRVRQNKCIAFADLNYLQDALQQLPSDPEVAKQDHILKLNILQGWETFFPSRGSGAILGVVDSGIDLNYVQTAPEKVEQANDTSFPYGISIAPGAEEELKKGKIPYAADEFGHGTEVGTIAAAKADNGVAGVGVAPNVAVINMKVFSLKGRTTEAHVAISMFIMTLLQADVVNMSIGCLGCFRAVKRKQGEFYEKMLDGLEKMLFKERIIKIPIFVAAAGNDGLDIVDAPARNATACNGPKQRVIAVGSYSFTTKTRSQDFSNYGPELCFVAPGDDVQTLHLGGEFKGTGPGTSFSTPQVAGLVALILSMEPELVNGGATAVIEKIKKCFVQDVDPPGYDEETGWGLIRIPSPEQVDPKQCPYFRK